MIEKSATESRILKLIVVQIPYLFINKSTSSFGFVKDRYVNKNVSNSMLSKKKRNL